MAKIKVVLNVDPETGKKYCHTQYLYFCLGCGFEHAFALKGEGGAHEFNMDFDNPTVSPSLLQDFVPGKLCHSYIRHGMIIYLKDCQHHLRGKIVTLPDIQPEPVN